MGMYRSAPMAESMSAMDHADLSSAMQSLLQDVDSEGHLKNPARRGPPISAAGQAGGGDAMPEKAGRNRGTLAEELALWDGTAAGNYAITTDGKRDATVASRWEKALN
eukprot:3767186-Pyramimonas_sp.AAC.1